MTCNLFSNHLHNHGNSTSGSSLPPPLPPTSPNHGNILERRTIQSTHISTISSLVDDTKVSTQQCHESQRDNYGLYALKYNRMAARQTGVLMNISTSNELNRGHNQNQYEMKHEHFEPCETAENDLSSLSYAMENREYYKIEFSEEGGLRSSHHSRQASRKLHAAGGVSEKAKVEKTKLGQAYECGGTGARNHSDDQRPKRAAPIPPVRVNKAVAPKAVAPMAVAPKAVVNTFSPSSSSASESSGTVESLPAILTHRSSHREVRNIQPKVFNIPITKKTTEITARAIAIEAQVKRTQLFRSPKNENLATISIAKAARTSALAPIKRGSSSDDSVNIFRPGNTTNAFDDFDEIFIDEPVHTVDSINNNDISIENELPPSTPSKLRCPSSPRDQHEYAQASLNQSSTEACVTVKEIPIYHATTTVASSKVRLKYNDGTNQPAANLPDKTLKNDEINRNDDYDHYDGNSNDRYFNKTSRNQSKQCLQPPKRYLTTVITV